MHDKPAANGDLSTAARPTEELVADLERSDPAEAPDLADAIAQRLEEGLASAGPEQAQPR